MKEKPSPTSCDNDPAAAYLTQLLFVQDDHPERNSRPGGLSTNCRGRGGGVLLNLAPIGIAERLSWSDSSNRDQEADSL